MRSRSNYWITPGTVMLTCVIACFGPTSAACAADEGSDLDNTTELAGPYCGLYCVYAAARNYNRSVDFAQLLDRKYLNRFEGSHIGELEAAAESIGLGALPLSGLSLDDLRGMAAPTILLLSRPRQAGTFKHWVLLTHAADDRFWIMESPGNIQEVSGAELLAQWSGVGLVVFADSRQMKAYERKHAAWKWLIAIAVAGAVVALSINLQRGDSLRHIDRSFGSHRFQPLLIFAVAIVVAVIWHVASRSGFLRNKSAVAYVQYNYFNPRLAFVDKSQFVGRLERREVLVIDSRLPDAYARGHISGAVNVPVFVTQTALREFVETVPRHLGIVVYCESEGCPWSQEIGSRLHLMGMKDVAIYPGGWKEWSADKIEPRG
ncbi:MAG TPA: rhodanese-like domain-containing protein [Pirellulaceae bacterium]|nr:rhodanese-like domain-containing protein [Pirellulaceae bacterium]